MYSSYCTKKNWYAKFLYATHLSAPTWLKRLNILKDLFLSEYLKKKDFGGFQVLGVHFLPFCEQKGFCAYFSQGFRYNLLAAVTHGLAKEGGNAQA